MIWIHCWENNSSYIHQCSRHDHRETCLYHQLCLHTLCTRPTGPSKTGGLTKPQGQCTMLADPKEASDSVPSAAERARHPRHSRLRRYSHFAPTSLILRNQHWSDMLTAFQDCVGGRLPAWRHCNRASPVTTAFARFERPMPRATTMLTARYGAEHVEGAPQLSVYEGVGFIPRQMVRPVISVAPR